jgi:RNA-directed DNA polymerase
MPALADNRGQVACAKRWRAISAQALLDGSDGDRPGRGALEAVSHLTVALHDGRAGDLGEADGQGCCDPLEPTRRLTMRRERIDDRAFLRLLWPWRRAGMLETEGPVVQPATGAPHGGRISPVLAQVYLPDALEVGGPRRQGALSRRGAAGPCGRGLGRRLSVARRGGTV